MKIIILPLTVNLNLFDDIWNKVKNTINVPVETSDTVQCSSDGVYVCDKGIPTRTQNKILMSSKLLNELDENDLNKSDVTKCKSKGSFSKRKQHTINLTKSGFEAIEELEKSIKEDTLRVDGDVLENLKQQIISDETKQPLTLTFEIQDGDGILYDNDFVDYGFSVEYKIHPRSGIEQSDIDLELSKRHCDYGNGMSIYEFNKKPCTILVLQEGQDVTPAQFNQLADQTERII